jgi:hypothetical protein
MALFPARMLIAGFTVQTTSRRERLLTAMQLNNAAKAALF